MADQAYLLALLWAQIMGWNMLIDPVKLVVLQRAEPLGLLVRLCPPGLLVSWSFDPLDQLPSTCGLNDASD